MKHFFFKRSGLISAIVPQWQWLQKLVKLSKKVKALSISIAFFLVSNILEHRKSGLAVSYVVADIAVRNVHFVEEVGEKWRKHT